MLNDIYTFMANHAVIFTPIIALLGPIVLYIIISFIFAILGKIQIYIKYKKFRKRMKKVSEKIEKETVMPDL